MTYSFNGRINESWDDRDYHREIATHTEAVDAHTSRNSFREGWPVHGTCRHLHALVKWLNFGIEAIERKVRRNSPFLKADGGLEDACQAGSSLKMTYNGLDGPDVERCVVCSMILSTESLIDSSSFLWVTCLSPSSVSLLFS